jgi:NAD(P)-dependent dehydrogenase (short-subunit alcohol dehydrogenase family)
MAGQRVLVTGAGTGVGRGIALAFARVGAAVVLHYSHSGAGALDTAESIRRAGGTAAALAADFANVHEVQDLARRAESFLGGMDVLVNSAGITMNRPVEETTAQQFDTLYAVNVRAPYFLTQTLLPALLQSRGSIINLSSIHAVGGRREHSVYAGTRGAIVSFTRSLAIELAPRGVRVNCIAPGPVDVENHHKLLTDDEIARTEGCVPIGFIGTPEDVGGVAVFLASPQARYIVGQTVVADGGTTAWFSLCDSFTSSAPVRFGKGYVPGV